MHELGITLSKSNTKSPITLQIYTEHEINTENHEEMQENKIFINKKYIKKVDKKGHFVSFQQNKIIIFIKIDATGKTSSSSRLE